MEPYSEIFVSTDKRLLIVDSETTQSLGRDGIVITRDLQTGVLASVIMSDFYNTENFRNLTRRELAATFVVPVQGPPNAKKSATSPAGTFPRIGCGGYRETSRRKEITGSPNPSRYRDTARRSMRDVIMPSIVFAVANGVF